MTERSAVVVGHEPSFIGWLKTTGLDDETIAKRGQTADRSVYLLPACATEEEVEREVERTFGAIFRHELRTWQPDESLWPDTGDFGLFTRWFTVEVFPAVADLGASAGELVPVERTATGR